MKITRGCVAVPFLPCRSDLMLQNKAANVPNWQHPGSLCSGNQH